MRKLEKIISGLLKIGSVADSIKILINTNINQQLKDELLSLSHKELSGGIKAVAYKDDKPIGWITDTDGIRNIFVLPKYRGLGLGKELSKILNKAL